MNNVLDLFSGIGGFSLGLERAGFTTVAFCEIEEFARKILAKHWPHVPIHTDIRELDGTQYRESVSTVCGGFPCQPYSLAGKQAGAADDRALWPEMFRIICEIQPTWVIGENVPGIINMELDAVLSNLEDAGYATQTFDFPACGIDAHHIRHRIWVVAHANRERVRIGPEWDAERWHQFLGRRYAIPEHLRADGADTNCGGCSIERKPEHREEQSTRGSESHRLRAGRRGHGSDVADTGCEPTRGDSQLHGHETERPQRVIQPRDSSSDVADANGSGLERERRSDESEGAGFARPRDRAGQDEAQDVSNPRLGRREGPWHGELGSAQPARWEPEPDVGRVATGIPNRVDRLKGLGNAVVPQIPEIIGRAILEYGNE